MSAVQEVLRKAAAREADNAAACEALAREYARETVRYQEAAVIARKRAAELTEALHRNEVSEVCAAAMKDECCTQAAGEHREPGC